MAETDIFLKPLRGESPAAFANFTAYCELGPEIRTIRKAAEITGAKLDAAERQASKWKWQARAAEHDAHQVRIQFQAIKSQREHQQREKIAAFRNEQERRAHAMGDLADLMMDLTAEKLQAMRAAGELPSEQQIANLAKTVASLADMAMNLKATALGVDDLVEALEAELDGEAG